MKAVLFFCVSILVLSGCTTRGQHEDAGMLIGGVLGGMLGAQVDDDHGPRTAAIIVGTMLGSQIGGSIGANMDDTDRLRTGQTLETVRTGVSSSWRNPDSGVTYRVTPDRTFTSASGPCREYTVDALIGGQREQVYGTACRQSDGTWQVRN